MKIKITIKNGDNTRRKITLFGILSEHNGNNGLPKNISVDVSIERGKDDWTGHNTISYKDLLIQCSIEPIAISINKTTNNRQLNFCTMNAYGEISPMIPQLTKNGKKRPANDEWDEKVWNIADTHEIFPLDNRVLFYLSLKPKQKFVIELDRIENIKLTDYSPKQVKLLSK